MAIERTELILGSLVMYPQRSGKPEVYRVNRFFHNAMELAWREGNDSRSVLGASFNEIIPIKITPDILKHNGFEHVGYNTWKLVFYGKSFYYQSDGFDGLFRFIKKFFQKGNFQDGPHWHCKYLHQLQKELFLSRITKVVTI